MIHFLKLQTSIWLRYCCEVAMYGVGTYQKNFDPIGMIWIIVLTERQVDNTFNSFSRERVSFLESVYK